MEPDAKNADRRLRPAGELFSSATAVPGRARRSIPQGEARVRPVGLASTPDAAARTSTAGSTTLGPPAARHPRG
jgi:hypothetical protein